MPPVPPLCPCLQAVDKNNAKRNVEQVSRHYVTAKRCSQEQENVSRGLIRGGTSVPLRGTPQEMQQVRSSLKDHKIKEVFNLVN